MPLVLRTLAKNDFSVIEEGHPVGRIRLASERRPQVWIWNVTIPEPGGGTGTAPDLDQAKEAFRKSWEKFKTAIGPDRLARVMELGQAACDRPWRTGGERPNWCATTDAIAPGSAKICPMISSLQRRRRPALTWISPRPRRSDMSVLAH